MASEPLFRIEALQSQKESFLGSTVLPTPRVFGWWTALALAAAIALVLFMVLGSYTKRTRVVGLLVPDAGVIRVMPPLTGVVIERRVSEGQSVEAGDVLFVLSVERILHNAEGVGGAQTAVMAQLRDRRASLISERLRRALEIDQQQAALELRARNLAAEIAQLDRELVTQRERITFLQAHFARYEDLAKQRFYSEFGLQQKRDEQLEQLSRLQAMERSQMSVIRELANVQAELKLAPLRGQREIAEVDRTLLSLGQELTSAEAERQVVITAPTAGTVTTILAEPGQVTSTKALLSLLPRHGRLEAHLFAPSRAVGFVEPGQRVLLRYAAFPYQKFGQYRGTVFQVSRSALEPSELPSQLPALGQQASTEGLYKITVALESDSVLAYGRSQLLTAGMQLEADILQERRRLIEWIIEPLQTVRGKWAS